MDTKLSILFYGKKAKTTKENLLPIYLRVTINGKRFETSTHRHITPGKWSVEAGRVKGNSEEARSINTYLDTLRTQVYAYQNELLQAGQLLTIETFKRKWLGVEEKPVMLLEVFEEHNQKMASLANVEYSEGTVKRYKTSLKHTADFLKWKYSLQDIDIRKVDHAFVTEYEFYLRSIRKCCNNSAVKYVKNFGKIIRICLANGWLVSDPFRNYTAKTKKVDRVFLSEEELTVMTSKEFVSERLGQVRDIFLFSCFTGLAYVDVQKLTRSNIAIGIDGEKWIYKNRQKTDVASRIPLLPTAVRLLDRYQDHPQCVQGDKLLPVLSNQKMNAYLKEIADVCGIDKPLTFHIARHTFATTVTLLNGVPIESVSKMLGHTSIRTTQHYAKILDVKVSEDMKLLRQKFS